MVVKLITDGTPFGDMTDSGGIAAAFDGDTTQSEGSSAEKITGGGGSLAAYIGKTLAAPSRIFKIIAYSPTLQGFINSTSVNNQRMELHASASAAPTNLSEAANAGTLIATETDFNLLTDNQSIITITVPDNRNLYSHVWVLIADNNSNNYSMTELEIYSVSNSGFMGLL